MRGRDGGWGGWRSFCWVMVEELMVEGLGKVFSVQCSVFSDAWCVMRGAAAEIRRPKSEGRRKSEFRKPKGLSRCVAGTSAPTDKIFIFMERSLRYAIRHPASYG